MNVLAIIAKGTGFTVVCTLYIEEIVLAIFMSLVTRSSAIAE